MRTFFRYPGGKGKLIESIYQKIIKIIHEYQPESYCEPFFGGGGAGLFVLSKLPNKTINNLILNDKDVGLACLWNSVFRDKEELKNKVKEFKPGIESFYQFKQDLLENKLSCIQLGFEKLAIHQLSFSGLGVKSGGPLGGKLQLSKYKIDCRWSPNYICKRIDELNLFFNQFNLSNWVTSEDFADIINKTDRKTIIYLDPPYYIKGQSLYQHSFGVNDHARLSESLKNTKANWVLSYDDCPEIRELYKWVPHIEQISANYSIAKSTKKTELLISNIC